MRYNSVPKCSRREGIITLACTNRCLGTGFRMILGKEEEKKGFVMVHKDFWCFTRCYFTVFGCQAVLCKVSISLFGTTCSEPSGFSVREWSFQVNSQICRGTLPSISKLTPHPLSMGKLSSTCPTLLPSVLAACSGPADKLEQGPEQSLLSQGDVRQLLQPCAGAPKLPASSSWQCCSQARCQNFSSHL